MRREKYSMCVPEVYLVGEPRSRIAVPTHSCVCEVLRARAMRLLYTVDANRFSFHMSDE